MQEALWESTTLQHINSKYMVMDKLDNGYNSYNSSDTFCITTF